MLLKSGFKGFVTNFITLFLLLLNSCLTLESVLTLNEDLSGEMSVTYTLDSTLKDISVLGEEDDITPLNLDEDYILTTIGGRDDITYRDYSSVQNEKGTVISVTFDFESLEALNAVFPEENSSIVKQSGASYIFSQVISETGGLELSSDTRTIFEDIFGEHFLNIVVNTPLDIKDVTGGERTNVRQAVYNRTFIDIITTPGKNEWEIRW